MAGPPSRHELTVDDIRALLTELGERLQIQGVEATLYVVGGAAMAIELDTRRVTQDVDGIFHPTATVRAEAEAMAVEHGLSKRWLNDSVSPWIPGGDDDAVPFSVPGLSVALASPRHLLAMKMAAFRPTDKADLELLYRELRITRPDQAADLAIEVYGDQSMALPSRDELLLEAESILARITAGERRTASRVRRSKSSAADD